MATILLITAGDIHGDTWDCRSSLGDFDFLSPKLQGPTRRGELLSAVLRTAFCFPVGKEESSPNKDGSSSLVVLLK